MAKHIAMVLVALAAQGTPAADPIVPAYKEMEPKICGQFKPKSKDRKDCQGCLTLGLMTAESCLKKGGDQKSCEAAMLADFKSCWDGR